jgi:NAD(P)-dependent dehydrogenase (short-subunit alcohol dehydrogenase family)
VTDLRGRTAVITGGNSGLGLAMAAGIGAAGARVVIWARDPGRSAAALTRLRAEGVQAEAVRCDVTDEGDVRSAMERTLQLAPAVDCVVANAGVAAAVPLVDTSLAQWHEVTRTNLDGTFLTVREAARHMVQRGDGGSIVIVSSLAARYGAAQQAAYASSKSALLGLGRTVAVELARHSVRCNVLLPGWTRTRMNEHLQHDERFVRAATARTPVRRWAEPDEFRAVAAFLADPTLTFHTRCDVVVDGGYSVF